MSFFSFVLVLLMPKIGVKCISLVFLIDANYIINVSYCIGQCL